MLLVHGNVRTLDKRDWTAVEVSETHNRQYRGARVEEVAVRVALWGAGRFKAFMCLLPIKRVRVNGIEPLAPFLLVRADGPVGDVKGLYGVENVLSTSIPNSFAKELIEKERELTESRVRGVVLGAFVRVLWGPEQMLCGVVTKRKKGMVTVKIEMRSRTIDLTISAGALEELKAVTSSALRVEEYFYAGE